MWRRVSISAESLIASRRFIRLSIPSIAFQKGFLRSVIAFSTALKSGGPTVQNAANAASRSFSMTGQVRYE